MDTLIQQLRLMIYSVPDGNVSDALYIRIEEANTREELQRIFLLTILISSRQSSYRALGFSLDILKPHITDVGRRLKVTEFKNNEEYLKLIRPVYEVLYKADLGTNEFIKEFEDFSSSQIVDELVKFLKTG